jgi:hypothetical protein
MKLMRERKDKRAGKGEKRRAWRKEVHPRKKKQQRKKNKEKVKPEEETRSREVKKG